MADANETIADIRKDAEAKFRELVEAWMQRRSTFQTTVGAMQAFNTLFDRIEAAHKREMSKNASKNGADFGQLVDCAKLREALVFCADVIDVWGGGIGDMRRASRMSRAALAAPPRNCDKYATADEALKAQEQMFNDSNFANGECKLGCPECDNPRVGCKIAWLFAPATEMEGGDDGK